MKRLLREPLVHFLLVGAILFGAYSYAERAHGGIEQATQNSIVNRRHFAACSCVPVALATRSDATGIAGLGRGQGARRSPLS